MVKHRLTMLQSSVRIRCRKGQKRETVLSCISVIIVTGFREEAGDVKLFSREIKGRFTATLYITALLWKEGELDVKPGC